MLWLICGTAVPFASGVAVVLATQLRSRAEALLATLLVTFAQIVVTLLVAGVVLQSLARATVLLLTLAITVLVVVACSARGRLAAGARAARERWRHGWDARPTVHPIARVWAWIAGTGAALSAAYLALVAFVVPAYAFDALWYHLSTVAAWIGADRIEVSRLEPVLNFFPMNGELSFLWTGILTGGDVWVDLPQVLFALLGALGVLAIARLVGVSRPGAIVAGSLFFLTPIVLAQASTSYVDIVLPGLFLAGFAFLFRFVSDLSSSTRAVRSVALPAFAGTGIGLAAGAKSTGLLYAAVVAVVLLANLVVAWRRGRIRGRAVGAATLAFVVPLLAFGSFWYLRSWSEYGNPVEPLTVRVAGHTVFTGLHRYDDGVDGLDRQMPNEIRDEPVLLRPLHSWANDPTTYDYQQRVGGLGRQWLWLELPALLVFAGWCLWKRRAWFANLVLPFVVIFVFTPANWWARLTVVIVAPGAVALVWCIERIRSRPLAALLQAVTLVVVGTGAVFVFQSLGSRALDITPAKVFDLLGEPRDQRTVAAFAAPEFRWADHTPPGSVVAVAPADVPARLYYLLTGPDFRNRVVTIDAGPSVTRDQLQTRLRAVGADYLYTIRDAANDRAAAADPECFTLESGAAGQHLYRFTCRASR